MGNFVEADAGNNQTATGATRIPRSGDAALIIRPAKNILGALRLPGDKSISHRYAMLGGIAQGATRLSSFSTGADCASTLSCLRQLGCKIERRPDGWIEIEGRERLQQPSESLDCGNS